MSRVVLRKLRAGYVHIYTPKLVGNRHWHIFRVTEGGDIVPQGNAFFAQPMATIGCDKPEHNTAGLQLITLPQAHLLKEFWIAFSSNLWNDKTREQNKANPAVMQRISIDSGSPNTFKPTGASLHKRVLECNYNDLKVGNVLNYKYPFKTVFDVPRLAEELSLAAAKHPKTAGKELAIVLRDPVAFANELNELRLARNEVAKAEASLHENAYPMKSLNTLAGLEDLLDKQAEWDAMNKVCPSVPRSYYDNVVKSSPLERFKGAIWVEWPLERQPKEYLRDPLGQLWTREKYNLLPEVTESLKKKYKKKIIDHYDVKAKDKWLKDFNEKMNKRHLIAVGQYEEDWWAAIDNPDFIDFFIKHFDENDPNNPQAAHSPGTTYAKEVHDALTPAPLVNKAVAKKYAEFVVADIRKPSSVFVRALAGNQAAVIKQIAEYTAADKAAADAASAYAHVMANRNDKLYDIAGGLFHKGAEHIPKHSWVGKASGHAMNIYSFAIAESGTGALAMLGLAGVDGFFHTTLGKKLLDAVKNHWLVQMAIAAAHKSVVSGVGLKAPMIISKEYALADIVRLVGTRPNATLHSLFGQHANGKITVELVTYGDEMAKYAGELDRAIAEGGGTLRVAGQALPPGAPPDPARTVRLTDPEWQRIRNARRSIGAAAAAWTKESADAIKSLNSLDGRLALGAIIVNGIVVIANVAKIEKGGLDAIARRNAVLAVIDYGSGTLSALGQAVEVVLKSNIGGRFGEEAVKKSVSITGVRALSTTLGAVVGVCAVIGQFFSAYDSYQKKQEYQVMMYGVSGLCFAGFTAIATSAATRAISEFIIAAGIEMKILRRFALRYGAQGMATLFGMSAQLWGVVLLIGAVGFEILAVVGEKSELQEWIQSTYFRYGKGKGEKFKSWDLEEAALENVGKSAGEQARAKAA